MLECKAKRWKPGKGRKERMKRKLEKLSIEKKAEQQKAEKLASKNQELKRSVHVK